MSIAKTMKAAMVRQRGAAELTIEDVATPSPGPGQVLIRVEAAGVNFSDVKRRRGDVYPFPTEFPYVPGGEVAGTIAAHGPGVEGPPVGTRVFALAGTNGFGGYAQYAVSYATTAIPVPEGMALATAAVLLVAGSTAQIMLRETARLREGESILVPAATGGVGSFAVQIARRLGAGKVIAAVSSPAKGELARALGAHDVVDYSKPEWTDRVRALTDGRGVDVALEASGGPMLQTTLRALGSFGRLIVFGAASGKTGLLGSAALEALLYAPAPNQSITGFNIGGWFMERPAAAGAALSDLMADVMAGRVRVPSIRTMPLSGAREAHDLMESGKASGKLVLEPWK